MTSNSPEEPSLRQLFDQISSTTISFGSIKGHIITQFQLAILEDFVSHFAGAAGVVFSTQTTTTGPSSLQEVHDRRSAFTRRNRVNKLIEENSAKSLSASPQERIDLNLELGKLHSELARLNKYLTQHVDGRT
jgi:hypothetical protein